MHGNLPRQAFLAWQQHRADRLGAACAFYTVFALGPLLLIAHGSLSLFSGLLGDERLIGSLQETLGPSLTALLHTVLVANRPRTPGMLAAVSGVVGLLVTATGLFIELQDALNTIFCADSRPQPGTWRQSLIRRVRAFTLLGVMNLLLVVLTLLQPAASVLRSRYAVLSTVPAVTLQLFCYVLVLPSLILVFAATFVLLPDMAMKWRHALLGGFWTALLFVAGRVLIGWYLSQSSTHLQFGAAGALAIVLLWIYYCAQIFFFGAELTRVYAQSVAQESEPVRQRKC